MDDAYKTKRQLIKELKDLRERFSQLSHLNPGAGQKTQANNNQKQVYQIFKNVPLGYQSLDENGRINEVNKAWLETSGYSTADLVIDRWFGEFLSPQSQREFKEKFPRLMASGFAQDIQFEMICADGSQIVVAIDGGVEYDDRGKFLQTHCIVRDISPHISTSKALESSLQRFNVVMNSMDAAIYVSDMESYDILFANQAVRDIFGEIEGKLCWQAFEEGQTGPCAFCNNDHLVKDGRPAGVVTREYQNQANGKWYFVQDRAIPWVDGRIVRLEISTDITERKEIEQSLKERERILNQTGIVLFIWQAKENWPVEYVSQNVRQFGYLPEDFYTERILFAQIVHPDDLERVAAEVAEYSREGDTEFDQEYRILTADGGYKWIEDHTIVKRDQQGIITHYQGIVFDVTARKDAEAAIQESEARYRQMFEAHPSMQWLVDPVTQQLVDVNPSASDFYGYSREEMRRMTVTQLNTLPQKEINSKLEQARLQKRNYFDVPHRLATGEIRQIEIHAAPISVKGRSLLYAILHDITERKKVEKALRKSNRELDLLNQAREVLNSSLNLDQVLTTVLDEVRFLLGAVACSVWLIDQERSELVCRQVTEPHSQVVRGWRLTLDQGIAGWVVRNNRSLLVPDAQADQRHFKGVDQKTDMITRSLLCVPLSIKEQVIGIVQVMDTEPDQFQGEDLALIESLSATASIAIENARLHEKLANYAAEMELRVYERTQELLTANKQLKELDRLKTKLIEDISHELRTPVANLSLYLDLIERGKPEKHDHYKAILRDKMDQLVRLTEDILMVFRLDLFKGDVEFVRLDINLVVSEVVDTCSSIAKEADLELIFDPGKHLPSVRAERKQLQQVVTNLIMNAINYTPAGWVRVKTGFDEQRGQLKFIVEDTGLGISKEERPYIFDRFYRGQYIGQSNIPGTGLGLAVVKDIVALHDGEILVETEVDKGTTFTVWLPITES